MGDSAVAPYGEDRRGRRFLHRLPDGKGGVFLHTDWGIGIFYLGKAGSMVGQDLPNFQYFSLFLSILSVTAGIRGGSLET